MRAAAVALAAALASAGCAPHAFVLPSGPGVPEPGAAAIWRDASARCRETTSVRAALGLSGRVRDRRIPGLAGARLDAAVTRDGRLGLEARVSGQLAFRLGGSTEHATLLLPQDDRVVSATPAAIVDALVGVRIGPERLLAVLAGCVTFAPDAGAGVRYGGVLAVETPDARVFLVRRGDRWVVRAGTLDALTVDYDLDAAGAPRAVSFRSDARATSAAALTLRIHEIARNTPIDPALFTVDMPAGAQPMTIDELRRSGSGQAAP